MKQNHKWYTYTESRIDLLRKMRMDDHFYQNIMEDHEKKIINELFCVTKFDNVLPKYTQYNMYSANIREDLRKLRVKWIIYKEVL